MQNWRKYLGCKRLILVNLKSNMNYDLINELALKQLPGVIKLKRLRRYILFANKAKFVSVEDYLDN